MKVLRSWLRDFVDVGATAAEIGERLSLRGLALDGLEPHAADDAVLDFDVTANRPDCLSVMGIAREVATAFELPLQVPEPRGSHARPLTGADKQPRVAEGSALSTPEGTHSKGPAPAGPLTIPVSIDDADLCARYVAAVADITVAPSPAWMQARLIACGLRPINNIVDVTNYVLLELGHPMHAFDYERLAGPAIVVRRARAGEEIQTLDGKRRQLAPDMLVIADADRPQAIGGVMGGGHSEVSAGTRRIVLESAWFLPRSVRATSKRLGLRTEASYRFERGADPTAPATAMRRALQLLEHIGAAHATGPVIDEHPRPHRPLELTLAAGAVPRLLGMTVPDTEVVRILRSLGFGVQTLGSWHAAAPEAALPMGQIGGGWRVTVPPWRVDVHRSVDLIEEVGRHHGFDHLPATFPAVEAAPPPPDPRIARDAAARRALLAMGFSEAITFAFIEAAAAAAFADGTEPVTLANPLSEKFTTLRPSLLPGLVDAVSHNRRHQRRDVRLFAIGTRFSRRGETRAAAAAWTGLAVPEHWSGGARDVDFFDIKGVAERLAAIFGVTPRAVAVSRGWLTEGRAAEMRLGSTAIGILGQLSPALAESRELPATDAIYVVELDLDALMAAQAEGPRLARPLPRHPFVVRDLSILVDDDLSAERVRGTIRTALERASPGDSTAVAAVRPLQLVDLREFDRYQGKGVPEGKVSLSLHLTFQAPDRTLTESEVHGTMQAIVRTLIDELGAVQR